MQRKRSQETDGDKSQQEAVNSEHWVSTGLSSPWEACCNVGRQFGVGLTRECYRCPAGQGQYKTWKRKAFPYPNVNSAEDVKPGMGVHTNQDVEAWVLRELSCYGKKPQSHCAGAQVGPAGRVALGTFSRLSIFGVQNTELIASMMQAVPEELGLKAMGF